ncbi:uncharacterized protein LOC127265469 isoform X2 [Andrographis paniculata]|uniref:uncharacterized protein LOC127265469 isoform X2 n=1 Tax=Andrographis paniculata TaxID=175694 RepID=UPI0021E750BB|nr:uncharacterized protein LOC127265469 isoform X2 [Andrographis paniculata]
MDVLQLYHSTHFLVHKFFNHIEKQSIRYLVECPRRFGRQSLCWYDQEYLQRLCCTDCPTDCSISQCILCYWRFRRKSKGTREERKRLQHNTNGWWPTWRFPFQCAMK